jgi:hypothetical protein
MEVSMAKKSKAETERFYRGVLAEHARSGKTVRAFAAGRGIPAGAISFWRHQLKTRDAERARARASESQFVPVRVVEEIAREPVREVRAPRASYEVVLGKGRVLRLPADFDDARVAALVRAVTSC